MKKMLSKEDLFNNFKTLVFKHHDSSDENLHALFEFAKTFNDAETIKRLATKYYLMDAIKYMEKVNSDINRPNLIELIVKNAGYEVIKKAIDQGVYINQKDHDGDTALIIASKLNEVDIVKLLLKNDADVHVKLKNGSRLVESVFELGYQEILRLLIEHGADDILEEYASNFFHAVERYITSPFIAKQFVYEELDAARHGNDEAMHFVAKSGVKEALYLNAMSRSLPEVDGVNSPQQILLFKCLIPIMNEDNRDLTTKIRMLTVQKVMNKYSIGKYENKILKLTLENSATILIYKDFAIVDNERFDQINERRFYSQSRQIYLDLLNNAVKFSLSAYNKEEMKEDYFSVIQQEEILKFDAKHNPKRLVEILNYFTKDNPIKYTAHSFDWSRYRTYKNFIIEVKKTFESIGDDLKFLSPNLYEKTTKFLFSDQLSEGNTWGINRIGFGWSSPGLDQWAHKEETKINGKKAIYFSLPEGHVKKVDGKTITTFGDVCNIFKNEIEIRDDDRLNLLFQKIEEDILGYEFEVEYINLDGITFYTDVENLTNGLTQVFEQFKENGRTQFDKIQVEAIMSDDSKYVDIKIIQIGSYASKTSREMMYETENGGFHDIKMYFTSLCDWSVEACCKDGNYRIDYLSIHNAETEVKPIEYIPNGFTYILRFYK